MVKTNVFDVAKYILEKKGGLSAMKLQKLVYYAQAWSLVWDDEPLFKNRIEAWSNGPVIKDLYQAHAGKFHINQRDKTISSFTTGLLSSRQKKSIDVVLDAYGDKSAQWLSDQTHSEAPWIDARKGLPELSRGDRDHEISLASMAEYYSSIN